MRPEDYADLQVTQPKPQAKATAPVSEYVDTPGRLRRSCEGGYVLRNVGGGVEANDEQRLYLIPCGDEGFTCLGFDVCERWTRGYVAWLMANAVSSPELVALATPGSAGLYSQYKEASRLCADLNARTGKRCNIELIPQLIGLEGKRVEVEDTDGGKRRFYVGKSTGWCPCHLEMKTRRSMGGHAVYGAPFKSVRVVG